MQISASKMVALVIATTCVIAAFSLEKSWPFALTVAAGKLESLALIWFPELPGALPDGARGVFQLTSRPRPCLLHFSNEEKSIPHSRTSVAALVNRNARKLRMVSLTTGRASSMRDN